MGAGTVLTSSFFRGEDPSTGHSCPIKREREIIKNLKYPYYRDIVIATLTSDSDR